MKRTTRLARTVLCPAIGPGPTLLVAALLTIALDVGHFYAWYIAVGIALLNLLVVRLVCWSLVTSIIAVLYVLLDKMALRYRLEVIMQCWRCAWVSSLTLLSNAIGDGNEEKR